MRVRVRVEFPRPRDEKILDVFSISSKSLVRCIASSYDGCEGDSCTRGGLEGMFATSDVQGAMCYIRLKKQSKLTPDFPLHPRRGLSNATTPHSGKILRACRRVRGGIKVPKK